jgi:energy-coupling factor transport system permease protein
VHPGSWAAWLALVMTVALTTSNPLYLVILLLTILLVAVLAPRTGEPAVGLAAVFGFAGGVLVLALLVAIVNGSYGEHVLFTVPGPSMPRWLGGLAIGGPVSAEGLVAAAVRGLGIACVILAFAAFNRAVAAQQVLRTTPAALFHAALVVTIGLTLLPAIVADVGRIRESRALRGAPAGLRAIPALAVPALIGGLERAMRTAEAMEARGYAASMAPARGSRAVAAVAPAVLVAAAWLWFFYAPLKPLAAVLALGAIAALAAVGAAGARSRTATRLRQERYHPVERGAAIVSAAGAAALVISGGGPLKLDYNPFAGLPVPGFELLEAGLLLLCAWPAAAFLAKSTGVDGADRRAPLAETAA